jgi:hypothetical protein
MIQGFLLATGARDHRPKLRRIAILAIDTAALVAVLAVPLRGMTDARPVVARVLEIEARTANAYDAAVAKFTTGKIPLATLVQMIDFGIRPELQEAAADLREVQRVPREQEPLVAAASEYLRLRTDSWRLRSDALRTSSTSKTRMLKEAGQVEWRAREALARMKDLTR